MAFQMQLGASKTIIFSFYWYIRLCVSHLQMRKQAQRGENKAPQPRNGQTEWEASLSHSNAFILSSPSSCLKGRHDSLVLLVGICEQEDPDLDLSSHLLPHSGLRQVALGAAATHPGSSHPSGGGGEAAADFIKSKRRLQLHRKLNNPDYVFILFFPCLLIPPSHLFLFFLPPSFLSAFLPSIFCQICLLRATLISSFPSASPSPAS